MNNQELLGRTRPPIAMTIAGSDSGAGAGVQADLKTFAALQVYGVSTITAITAQNTLGVFGIHEVPVPMIEAQIRAVVTDIGVDTVKTGMLSSVAVIESVVRSMREYELKRIVVDPVMIAKGGDRLLQASAVEAIREILLPIALVATPNAEEASVLTGQQIHTLSDAKKAAEMIFSFGPKWVVIKGGHFGNDATDLLFDGTDFTEFSTPRVITTSTHGTGCTFASAIAAELAKGEPVTQAVNKAKAYVLASIKSASPIGAGHGPMNHFHHWWD
jgi:hydroxymethylpyrimidine/phosphomethylpyrimidine kinase